jgi:nucleoside-diphosphate-sugar epimerase
LLPTLRVLVWKTDPNDEKATMSTQYQETKKPRILIIGSTGRIGSRVIAEIAKVDAIEAIYSSRTLEQVGAWRKDGKDAVLVDLDRPETFREAVPVGNLRPEILVMQPAQNWHGQRATDGLDSTWDWRVLVQR